ncbi:MAG: hydrogenase maturation protease [Thermodesulfobacteriota bacterium]
MPNVDEVVKSQKSDGTVKSSRCKARKSERMRRTYRYAATTEDAAERRRWTFYEAVNVETKLSSIWIIGYGNPQRRDDGIGPYAVTKLREILKHREEIHFFAPHQLEPDLAFELKDAALIIFVDAAMNELRGGWEWTRVEPELRSLSYLTHHFNPAFLLGLLQSLYNENPEAWMISVQGEDFDIGEGLTKEVEDRVSEVVAEIKGFLMSNYIA